MRRLTKGLILIALAAALAHAELPAVRAQGAAGRFYGWYPYVYPYLISSRGEVPTPPYFAIHPPVYYGRRVGMPYGNSPFPRPPRPVVRARSQPVQYAPRPGIMIENPYVENKVQAKPRKRRTDETSERKRPTEAPGSKAQLNPYVLGEGEIAGEVLTSETPSHRR